MTTTSVPIPETTTTTPRSRPRGLRIAGIAAACVAAVAALGGAGLLAVDSSERNADGYYTTDPISLTSDGYAVASDPLEFGDLDGGAEGFVADHLLGKVRVTATSTNGKPLLVGIAPRKQLDAYLASVASTRVTDLRGNGQFDSREIAGGAPAGAPTAQSFWAASSVGTGTRDVDWKIRSGNWGVAVLNADGSPHVGARVKVAASTDLLQWLGFGFLTVGLLTLGGAVVLLRAGRTTATRA